MTAALLALWATISQFIPWVLGGLALFWAGGKWQNKKTQLNDTNEKLHAVSSAQKRYEEGRKLRKEVESHEDLHKLTDDELLERGNELLSDLRRKPKTDQD